MSDETRLTAAFIERFTDWTGLEVAARRETFIRCLRERAAATGFPSLPAYLAPITSAGHAEIGRLVDALMIGYSWLFRDTPQMQLIIQLLAERQNRAARAHVWVAGCATGEDVYTLALLAGKLLPLDLLGTDVNHHALDIATQGRYPVGVLRVVPAEYQRYFRRHGDAVVIDETIRQGVRFAAHNLMDPAPAPPAGTSWDVIACRNVLIHFSAERRQLALRHLSAALSPGGFLLLGAGEIPPFMPDLQRTDRDGYCVLYRNTVTPLQNTVTSPQNTLTSPQNTAAPLQSTATQLQTAATQLQRGQFDAAIATCSSVLQRERLSAEALLLSGVACSLSGRDGEAVATLQQALFLRPELWPAAYYLALSLERIGQVAAAGAAYQWVVRESHKPRFDEQPVLELLGITAWRAELVLAAKARAQQLLQPAAAE